MIPIHLNEIHGILRITHARSAFVGNHFCIDILKLIRTGCRKTACTIIEEGDGEIVKTAQYITAMNKTLTVIVNQNVMNLQHDTIVMADGSEYDINMRDVWLKPQGDGLGYIIVCGIPWILAVAYNHAKFGYQPLLHGEYKT
jgi:hypothetical protein